MKQPGDEGDEFSRTRGVAMVLTREGRRPIMIGITVVNEALGRRFFNGGRNPPSVSFGSFGPSFLCVLFARA